MTEHKNIVPLALVGVEQGVGDATFSDFLNKLEIDIDHIQRQDNYQYCDNSFDREYRILVEYAVNDAFHKEAAHKVYEELNPFVFARFKRWVGDSRKISDEFPIKITMSVFYQRVADENDGCFSWEVDEGKWSTDKVRIAAIYDNTEKAQPCLKINKEYIWDRRETYAQPLAD